ncbi:unnamed protein product (macronuclear) [Paramecium tetraurelia]|uniref:Uncharacterized protein n=1 Tax=Paramecium tetraurelia TaxID=5888 RepID=A0BUU1_PARTE|nr:uncharacterized protein GSPATT00005554001 [Paramecium tetraurelia]CAK62308.1 unnamed protein product [Paramecium tetraurelia]|eukprot:XP_001429706.1 hypothetical protein (macronuclear) [Paramecium tetraurelia strain d4-2]
MKLRYSEPGSENKRINYFKLNQGYDVTEDDSEYVDDQDSYKAFKKIRKYKTKSKKEKMYIMLANQNGVIIWKCCYNGKNQLSANLMKQIKEGNHQLFKLRIIVLKKILGTDLSQYVKGVQGIFIDNLFRKDLKNLDLSKKLISNGILFIWSDKGLINEILEIMESKGFTYIENLVVVQLSLEKALEELNKHMKIEQTEEAVLDNLNFLQQKVQVKDLIVNCPSKVLNQSKQVLIMFRKFDEQKTQLELRHQRTPDVLFDFVSNGKKSEKSKEYIYQTIETLLPKSQLMEIFAQRDQPRKDWISVCESK